MALFAAALGFAAAFVQLLTVEWDLHVRLALIALLVAASYLAFRYRSWMQKGLTGTECVLIELGTDAGSRISLKRNGKIAMRPLPTSSQGIASPGKGDERSWEFDGEQLVIVVGARRFELRPMPNGLWMDEGGAKTFLGGIVDPTPPKTGRPFVALKHERDGVQRQITADGIGDYAETDIFGASCAVTGSWTAPKEGELHVESAEGWTLDGKEWHPGVLVGKEFSGEGVRDFVMVRLRASA